LEESLRIAVTGAGGPAGLNTIRSLAEKYYVVALDANLYSEGFLFASKHYLVPYARDPDYINRLAGIVDLEDISIIIPTVDEEIRVLSREKARLKAEVIVHPPESVEVVLDKYLTYSFLSKRLPDIVPSFGIDPEDVESEVIVEKPRCSRGSRNISILRKEDAIRKTGYVYVEYLPGREWTVDILTSRNGEIVIAIPRIRLKTRGGISIMGEVKLDEHILDVCRRIASVLKFRGPLNMQFKEDVNGVPKLTEINPRFSGGLDITIAAGADLPKLLIDLWVYDKIPEVKIREGIYVKVWHTYRWIE